MASINPTTSATAARQQQLLAQQAAAQQQAALTSPYDGTSPTTTGMGVPQLTGLTGGAHGPQVNLTNQTALAPNGDVNQVVTNQNQYTNKYYNIIVPSSGALFGGWGGAGGLFGGSGIGGNAFVDPQTGVLYVQRSTGITGWIKRLFGGS